jgi:hypothetical protein
LILDFLQQVCHAGLCNLIENGCINLSSEATRITQIIGQILSDVEEGEDIASSETCEKLTSILQTMGNELPPETMSQAFGALGAESQNAIAMAVQELSRSRSRIVTP